MSTDGAGADDLGAQRVLILDRDRVTCEALAEGLEDYEDLDVVDWATSARDVVTRLDEGEDDEPVDVVVAGGGFHPERIIELARGLRERDWERRPFLVVTGVEEDDPQLLGFIEAGVSAFLVKGTALPGLAICLRLLARGEVVVSPRMTFLMMDRLAELADACRESGIDLDLLEDLTPREREILEHLSRDLTNREIGRRLYITEGTVKSHVHHILRKLNVDSREDAARFYHAVEREG